MQHVDWSLVLNVAIPIACVILGIVLDRVLERKQRLIAGYTAELATLVTKTFGDRVDNAMAKEIYDFSKAVALESFKNGLAAKRRSAPLETRSALQAGRLTRASA